MVLPELQGVAPELGGHEELLVDQDTLDVVRDLELATAEPDVQVVILTGSEHLEEAILRTAGRTARISDPLDGPVDHVGAAASKVQEEVREQTGVVTGQRGDRRRAEDDQDDVLGVEPGQVRDHVVEVGHLDGGRAPLFLPRVEAEVGRAVDDENRDVVAGEVVEPDPDGVPTGRVGKDDDGPVARPAHHLGRRSAPTSGDGTRSAQSCP